MSKTHLIIPDAHAHPKFHNKRAVWLGHLINDVKPDVVINIGDTADMPSLASYDKGTRGFIGESYRKDIESAVDFEDRLWSTVRKQKKKMPHRIKLHGNHEQRIGRVLESATEIQGIVSYEDLQEKYYYDEIVPYNGQTPGSISLDGISYAHYFASGVMGRPIGGEHPAYQLLSKKFGSCTQGHVHTADFCIRTDKDSNKIFGCVVGVYQDYESGWAGEINKLWWRGVVVKRNVKDGQYDPEFISLDRLKRTYG